MIRLAAIQGLFQELQVKDAQLAAQAGQLRDLAERIRNLEDQQSEVETTTLWAPMKSRIPESPDFS